MRSNWITFASDKDRTPIEAVAGAVIVGALRGRRKPPRRAGPTASGEDPSSRVEFGDRSGYAERSWVVTGWVESIVAGSIWTDAMARRLQGAAPGWAAPR